MQNLNKDWFVASKMTRISWNLIWAHQIPKTSTLIGSFCVQYRTFELKYTGELSFTTLESEAKFEEKFMVLKMTWGIFPRALGILKNWDFDGILNLKQKMHKLKIYRGVMCQDNEEWCEIWRKIDVSFQNWHGEFDEFWPDHSKVSIIWILMGSFWKKLIMSELKNT